MIGALRILEVALPMLALTQPPDTAFMTAAGGPGEDWSFALTESSRGEIVLAGHTTSFGSGDQDGWVLAMDQSGDSLWSSTFGNSGGGDHLLSIQALGNGFIMTGVHGSHPGRSRDFWVLRLDSLGNEIWSRTYGGVKRESPHCIVIAPDGGYLIAGRTESHTDGKDMDFWILKVNEYGDSLWSKTFGGSGYDALLHVSVFTDGYLLCGATTSDAQGTYDGWITRINLQGDSLWGHTIGGQGHDRLRATVPADDGGCFAGGSTESVGAGSLDFWLLRFDSEGELLWQRTYGGPGQEMSFLTTPADSFLFMCGHTFSYGAGQADGWLLKVNAQGDSIWSQTFGGPENDDFYGVIRTSDGGIAAAGYTQSFSRDRSMDFWLVKTLPDTAAIEYVNIKQLTAGKTKAP